MTANLACVSAMAMWAFGFPAGEVLLESWGAISLLYIRLSLGVALLLLLWVGFDGASAVARAPWVRGMFIGGVGFGIGALLLLVGQKLSDAVTPAIAVAMMPIAGAAIEVMLDGRRMNLYLASALVLALLGGYLATGVDAAKATFGIGALMCLAATILFAWATRATTRSFDSLSTIGQTAVTLSGGLVFVLLAQAFASQVYPAEIAIGRLDTQYLILLAIFALPSSAVAQLLWIWGARGLGILLASFHMNAVPFYVMVIVMVWLDGPWQWGQAVGAALVALAVMIAQLAPAREVAGASH